MGRPSTEPCRVEGCTRTRSNGYLCGMHHKRLWKTGDVGPAGELPKIWAKPPKVCDVDGCERLTRSANAPHCEMHRRRAATGADLTAAPRARNVGKCAVDGCSRKAATKHLCKGHYARLLRFGDPGTESIKDQNVGWETPSGYRMRYVDKKPVGEHRIVMEALLGRPLPPGSTVHHVDGNRSNNDPGNLELWNKGQPAGQRTKDKIEYSAKFLVEHGFNPQVPTVSEVISGIAGLV